MQFSILKALAIASVVGGAIATPGPRGEVTFDDVARQLKKDPEGVIRFTDDAKVLSVDGSGAVIDSADLNESQFEAYKAVLAKRDSSSVEERDERTSASHPFRRQIFNCPSFRCYSHRDCTDPYPDCSYCGDPIYNCR